MEAVRERLCSSSKGGLYMVLAHIFAFNSLEKVAMDCGVLNKFIELLKEKCCSSSSTENISALLLKKASKELTDYISREEHLELLEELIGCLQSVGKKNHACMFDLLENGLTHLINAIFRGLTARIHADNESVQYLLEQLLEAVNIFASVDSSAKSVAVLAHGCEFLELMLNSQLAFQTKMEIMKSTNLLLEQCPIKTKEQLMSMDNVCLKVSKLIMLIKRIGDYELQVGLLECLVRLFPKKHRQKYSVKFFQDSEMLEGFLNIKDTDFEMDCRHFLNDLNNRMMKNKGVFSIACNATYIGSKQLLKPSDAGYDEFWVDFNIGSQRITMFCEQSSLSSQMSAMDEDLWETVAIYKSDVHDCNLTEIEGQIVLEVILQRPVREIYPSQHHDVAEKNIRIEFPMEAEMNLITAVQSTFSASQKQKVSQVSTPVQISLSKVEEKVVDGTGACLSQNQVTVRDYQSTCSQDSTRPSRCKVSVPSEPMRLTPLSTPVIPFSRAESASQPSGDAPKAEVGNKHTDNAPEKSQSAVPTRGKASMPVDEMKATRNKHVSETVLKSDSVDIRRHMQSTEFVTPAKLVSKSKVKVNIKSPIVTVTAPSRNDRRRKDTRSKLEKANNQQAPDVKADNADNETDTIPDSLPIEAENKKAKPKHKKEMDDSGIGLDGPTKDLKRSRQRNKDINESEPGKHAKKDVSDKQKGLRHATDQINSHKERPSKVKLRHSSKEEQIVESICDEVIHDSVSVEILKNTERTKKKLELPRSVGVHNEVDTNFHEKVQDLINNSAEDETEFKKPAKKCSSKDKRKIRSRQKTSKDNEEIPPRNLRSRRVDACKDQFKGQGIELHHKTVQKAENSDKEIKNRDKSRRKQKKGRNGSTQQHSEELELDLGEKEHTDICTSVKTIEADEYSIVKTSKDIRNQKLRNKGGNERDFSSKAPVIEQQEDQITEIMESQLPNQVEHQDLNTKILCHTGTGKESQNIRDVSPVNFGFDFESISNKEDGTGSRDPDERLTADVVEKSDTMTESGGNKHSHEEADDETQNQSSIVQKPQCSKKQNKTQKTAEIGLKKEKESKQLQKRNVSSDHCDLEVQISSDADSINNSELHEEQKMAIIPKKQYKEENEMRKKVSSHAANESVTSNSFQTDSKSVSISMKHQVQDILSCSKGKDKDKIACIASVSKIKTKCTRIQYSYLGSQQVDVSTTKQKKRTSSDPYDFDADSETSYLSDDTSKTNRKKSTPVRVDESKNSKSVPKQSKIYSKNHHHPNEVKSELDLTTDKLGKDSSSEKTVKDIKEIETAALVQNPVTNRWYRKSTATNSSEKKTKKNRKTKRGHQIQINKEPDKPSAQVDVAVDQEIMDVTLDNSDQNCIEDCDNTVETFNKMIKGLIYDCRDGHVGKDVKEQHISKEAPKRKHSSNSSKVFKESPSVKEVTLGKIGSTGCVTPKLGSGRRKYNTLDVSVIKTPPSVSLGKDMNIQSCKKSGRKNKRKRNPVTYKDVSDSEIDQDMCVSEVLCHKEKPQKQSKDINCSFKSERSWILEHKKSPKSKKQQTYKRKRDYFSRPQLYNSQTEESDTVNSETELPRCSVVTPSTCIPSIAMELMTPVVTPVVSGSSGKIKGQRNRHKDDTKARRKEVNISSHISLEDTPAKEFEGEEIEEVLTQAYDMDQPSDLSEETMEITSISLSAAGLRTPLKYLQDIENEEDDSAVEAMPDNSKIQQIMLNASCQNKHVHVEESGFVSGPSSTIRPSRSSLKRKYPNELEESTESSSETDTEKEAEISTFTPRELFREQKTEKGQSAVDSEVFTASVSCSEDTRPSNHTGIATFLQAFGSDITSHMKAKRQRIESVTRAALKGTQKCINTSWSQHQQYGQDIIAEYTDRMSKELGALESGVLRLKESEIKTEEFFREQLKILKENYMSQKDRLENMRTLQTLLSQHSHRISKHSEMARKTMQDELKAEVKKLQQRLLQETHQQELMNVRKRLQTMLL